MGYERRGVAWGWDEGGDGMRMKWGWVEDGMRMGLVWCCGQLAHGSSSNESCSTPQHGALSPGRAVPLRKDFFSLIPS